MKIAIAADHGGYKLKEEIKPYIESLGHTVTDFGTYSEDSVDYPDYAAPCARAVVSGEAEQGHCDMRNRHRHLHLPQEQRE